MADPLEPRVIELEERLAYYEKLADDLSAVLAEQARQIDTLGAQVHHLAERLSEIEATTDRIGPDDKPPPHY